MKRLAVRAQNNLVNIVTFLGLGQDNEEPGGSFTARLKGQAAICAVLSVHMPEPHQLF